MTREEAIVLFEKQLTAAQVVLDSGFGSNPGENDSLYRRRREMAEIALSALRPVSREQVEKVWNGCSDCTDPEYSVEECILSDSNSVTTIWNFCATCGCPLTDEAVQMVMERLEELSNGKG